jgi:curved DNA-binding protein CbpA
MVDNLKCWEYLNESEITSQQVKDTYRKLSLKYHPDKGGNNEAMSAISEFKEALI